MKCNGVEHTATLCATEAQGQVKHPDALGERERERESERARESKRESERESERERERERPGYAS